MLGALKKRWMKSGRTESDVIRNGEDNEKQEITPPPFMQIADGKITFTPPAQSSEPEKNNTDYADRIREVENALLNLQDVVNKSQEKPGEFLHKLESEVKCQIADMNRSMKTRNEKTMEVCRDYIDLQVRFTDQEVTMKSLQKKNIVLQQRIQQYENCLDDVLRKVVDTIVAEDKLRMEVVSLKDQVRVLQSRNNAIMSSPSKNKDEGYSTMSSGQPQPSISHMEGLTEEAELWMLPLDASAEIEDWSLSQDEMELQASIDDPCVVPEWNGSTNNIIVSTITEPEKDQVEEPPFVYSEDINLKQFPINFYKLIEIYNCEEQTTSFQLNDNDDDGDNESSLGNDIPNNLLGSFSSDGLTTSSTSSDFQLIETHSSLFPIKEENLLATSSFSSWESSKSWKKLNSPPTETLKPLKSRNTNSKIPLLKKSPTAASRKTKLPPPPVPVRQTNSNKS